MYRLACLAIGYGFGLIQSAFIISKVFFKVDIREHGSKNAGTTNVNRVLGLRAGLVVLACDMLKATAACFICWGIFRAQGWLPVMWAAIGVILGHDFPFYMRFRGGKGIASTCGILLCYFAYDWRIAVICFASILLVIAVTRLVSLGSLTMLALYPALTAVFTGLWNSAKREELALALAVAALAYIRHRKNIVRLATGKEPKLTFNKRQRGV